MNPFYDHYVETCMISPPIFIEEDGSIHNW